MEENVDLFIFRDILDWCCEYYTEYLFSLYALGPNSDLLSWEQFHSVIGEIMFVPWILLYIGFVIYCEKRCHRASGEVSVFNSECCSSNDR